MEIGPEELIQGLELENENSSDVSLPTLQYLVKVLPDKEEVFIYNVIVYSKLKKTLDCRIFSH